MVQFGAESKDACNVSIDYHLFGVATGFYVENTEIPYVQDIKKSLFDEDSQESSEKIPHLYWEYLRETWQDDQEGVLFLRGKMMRVFKNPQGKSEGMMYYKNECFVLE